MKQILTKNRDAIFIWKDKKIFAIQLYIFQITRQLRNPKTRIIHSTVLFSPSCLNLVNDQVINWNNMFRSHVYCRGFIGSVIREFRITRAPLDDLDVRLEAKRAEKQANNSEKC